MDTTNPVAIGRAQTENGEAGDRPTREETERAVRTLLRFVGEDPDREGLIDTPSARGSRL